MVLSLTKILQSVWVFLLVIKFLKLKFIYSLSGETDLPTFLMGDRLPYAFSNIWTSTAPSPWNSSCSLSFSLPVTLSPCVTRTPLSILHNPIRGFLSPLESHSWLPSNPSLARKPIPPFYHVQIPMITWASCLVIVSLCNHLPSSGISSLKEETVAYSLSPSPTPNSVFSGY